MKKRSRKKSEKQTQEELLNLQKTFRLEEVEQIKQLVRELHKIRKVEKPTFRHFWHRRKALKEQIDMILEQQFYYIGDFIIVQGWHTDKVKVEALWKYLKFELG